MTSEFAIAVHALVYLNHKQETLASEELAKNVCTNPARIRKVMAKLKKKDLIATKEGQNGGYHTSMEAADVNLAMIYDALETEAVCPSWKSGNPDMDCMVASGMADIMDREGCGDVRRNLYQCGLYPVKISGQKLRTCI